MSLAYTSRLSSLLEPFVARAWRFAARLYGVCEMHAAIMEGLKSPRTARYKSTPNVLIDRSAVADSSAEEPRSARHSVTMGQTPPSPGLDVPHRDSSPSPLSGSPRRSIFRWGSPRASSEDLPRDKEKRSKRGSFVESMLDSFYRRLANMADDFHLGMTYSFDGGMDLDLEEGDIFMDRASSMGSSGLFLGEYTQEEIDKAILGNEKFKKALAQEGFEDLKIFLDTSSAAVHKILLRDQAQHDVQPAANNPTPHYVTVQLEDVIDDRVHGLLLMELAMRLLTSFDSLKGFKGPHRDVRTTALLAPLKEWDNVQILVGEWLLLQNPTKSFKPGEQPLPGQSYPGLRVGRIVADMLLGLARKRGRDGIVNAPLYYHNAVLYAMHGCQFLNPEFEGIFSTLSQDLMPLITSHEVGLAVVSRAVFSGRLFHIPTGRRVKWLPGQTQMWAVSDRMRAWCHSKEYGEIRDSFTTSGIFRLDLDDPGYVNQEEFEAAIPLDEIDTRGGVPNTPSSPQGCAQA